jgi:malonyl CoA-acyl carrier protein transacylase
MEVGPEEALNEDFAGQIAVYVISCGIWEVLEDSGFRPEFLAAYSSGLYAACVAAGVFDFETGLGLMAEADRCVRESAPSGGMTVILGLSGAEVRDLIETVPGRAHVSIVNTRHQIIVSGEHVALDRLEEAARRTEALNVRRLSAGAPYHSRLMAPVDVLLEDAVSRYPVAAPRFPIVSYGDGSLLTTDTAVRGLLGRQFKTPVDWAFVVESLVERGVECMIEVGAGRMLGRTVRWIDREMDIRDTDRVDSLRRLVREFGGAGRTSTA